ncbi:MAG: Na/Pi symporter [Acidobacteriota bacterium]|nr:Na/Pi symporter [Acidobacteriota bacterium]
MALLWVFLVCINGLSTSIKGFGEDAVHKFFASAENPIIGLMMGMLVTCLVQSSSTTTSLIVGLVATGELGVGAAVPMIMGANIGTTITNTLVSMGSLTRSAEFKRSFAAANIHDVFNLTAVVIMLPLEVAFKVISVPAKMITDMLMGTAVDKPQSPIKEHFKAVVDGVFGFFEGMLGSAFAANWILLIVSVTLLIVSLYLIVRTMKGVILSRAEAFFDKILGRNAVICMIFGAVVTAAVQSSSVTTSIMVPLAGAGVASLRVIFPITLGCNVGTTITALLAAIATGEKAALTIAICHVIFNMYGILLLYPVPKIRNLIIKIAEWLAERCTDQKSFALVYVVGVFYMLPGAILGIQKALGY